MASHLSRDPQRIDRVALIIGSALKLHPRDASKLAESWWRHVLQTKASWELAARIQLAEARERAAEFEGGQLDALRDQAEVDPRGLVLATIHMGDYLGALFAIAHALSKRPFVVVRRRPVSVRDARVFGKLEDSGINLEVIVTGERSASLRLARRLKNGSAAVMFYDLHDGFGRTQPVRFFGQHVQWVEGPVRLAASCDALLVPFAVARCPLTDQNLLQMEAAVEFASPQTSAAECSAVLQWLASIAENTVRRFPDQWLHWSQLPRMASIYSPASS